MKSLSGFALAALAAGVAFGQASPARLEFEVASIRPSQPNGPERVDIGVHLDGSQVRIASFSIRDFVGMAYRLKPYQIAGPDWTASERFNLNATLPAGSASSQIPEMLQAFLTERFQIKTHREKKDLPVYAVVLGKLPLKLKETPSGEPESGDP